MAYSEAYKNFRDRFCPELDLDDPRILLRLDEEIDKLEKKLGKE